VSCLLPLHRNPDALLSGLSTGSISASTSSSGLAGAYLWDLRKPRKPASSLDYQPEPLGAAGAADGPTSGSVPGVLCLSVHEDGALAAAGLRDGRVLVWDMRKVSAERP
jgi:WD40 repeat protein